MSKIAIIGAGASGLICAIEASKNSSNSITIFEQNSKPAKKIIASGNGKCNISNSNLDYTNYYSSSKNYTKFLNFVLNEFSAKKLREYFLSIGLDTIANEDGKTYPINQEAKSVSNALINGLDNSQNINMVSKEINNIEFRDDKYIIDDESFDRLVIASGSNASVKSGDNDTNIGLKVAKQFKHNIFPTYPALVQLNLDYAHLDILSGLKQKAKVVLYIDDEQISSSHDDILFTKYGISGLAILDISTVISKTLNTKSDKNNTKHHIQIELNLFTHYEAKQLEKKILALKKSIPNHKFASILDGFISSKLTNTILKIFSIDSDTKITQIGTKTIKQIIAQLTSWKFDISSTRDLKYAEVAGGGVDIDEIDKTSMQSKLQDNLYFCGEVLDVVGQRGGYNLHFAFGSGYIAGKDIYLD